MSGIRLDTDIRGLTIPEKQMADLSRIDTHPLMEEIGEFLVSQTALNFDKTQTPDGEQWKKSERAKSEGGKTLTGRGHYRDSYTYNASNDDVEVGCTMIYAAIHHHGGVIKAKDGGYLTFKIGDQWIRTKSVVIPQRQALGMTEDYEQEIGQMAMDYHMQVFH